jgi:hypothetical protein
MNYGNFGKVMKDAMSLFNTFGVMVTPQINPGYNPYDMPQMNNRTPYAMPRPDQGYNQGGPTQETRPPLPSLNIPNIKNRDIKKTNEYYLEKVKNFLNKQF